MYAATKTNRRARLPTRSTANILIAVARDKSFLDDIKKRQEMTPISSHPKYNCRKLLADKNKNTAIVRIGK